jgi:hypothetical protein|tara:strand:- start:16 stop:399 length:384 start_codon:yes stop_codon:yes gene_type:complete
MSEHDPKVVFTYAKMKQPEQDYDNFEGWINVDGRSSFQNEIYSIDTDIFGIVPKGLDFAHSKVVKMIVDIFQQIDGLKYLVSEETYDSKKAFFMNKRLADKDGNGIHFNFSEEKDVVTAKGLFKSDG